MDCNTSFSKNAMSRRGRKVCAGDSLSKQNLNNSFSSSSDDINLDSFQYWLKFVHKDHHGQPLSPQSVMRVKNRVKELTSGQGVGYVKWPRGVKFYGRNGRNDQKVVDLTTNYEQLLKEAKEFMREHGEDPGNGWLLTYPISKLLQYQKFVMQQRLRVRHED